MKEKKIVRFVLIYILSGIAFFVLTMPFHQLLSVFSVTEVRPSAVLYPLLGTSFGWPAAFGIMTANFIFDCANGYPTNIIVIGLFLQVLYVMIPHYLWRYLMKGEEHTHRLNSVGRVLKYTLVCFVFSVVSAIGVGCFVYFNFGASFIASGGFVLMNNFCLSVMLGCPLMVVFNQIISRRRGTKREISRNEIVILLTALVQVVVVFVTGRVIYNSGNALSTYDIWNTIYLYSVGEILLMMGLSLICMIFLNEDK